MSENLNSLRRIKDGWRQEWKQRVRELNKHRRAVKRSHKRYLLACADYGLALQQEGESK